MAYIMVDVEADGPIPGDYSMIEIGAVLCSDTNKTFHGKLCPISKNYEEDALKVFGCTRKDSLTYDDPERVMLNFANWLTSVSGGDRPMFISDNNGFDYMFVCWYFWHFTGKNPFGHSSTNLGSLYKGLVKTCFKNFKHLRKTRHTHNPVDDSMGNVEALVHMKDKMGLGIKL